MTGDIKVDIHWTKGDQRGQAHFPLGVGVTALIGPSGAGKSSLARLIAGIDRPTSGTIKKDDKALFCSETGVHLRPEKRKIGYVPQAASLFPNMLVRENIAFGSRLDANVLQQLIRTADIDALLDRRPHTLSGGEARRVAIVRALASDPALVILDEPLNGLDPNRRLAMLALIRQTAQHTGIPILLITHQIEEMLHAADHAILMNDGKTLMHGTIEDVMAHPQTATIMQYDDAGVVLEVEVIGRQDGVLEAKMGDTSLFLPDEGEKAGTRLRLRILARDVAIALNEPQEISIINRLPCRVKAITASHAGRQITLSILNSGACLQARITEKSFQDLGINVDQQVFALVKAVAVREMLTDTGAEQPA